MKHNWESYLSSGEKIELEFGISKKYSSAVLAMAIAVSIVIAFSNIFASLGIVSLGFLYWTYLTKGKKYALTNKKIILVDVFLGRNVTNINYDKITDISINQDMADMIGNWGNVIINTAGHDFAEAILHNIDNPQKVKSKIDELTESSQKK